MDKAVTSFILKHRLIKNHATILVGVSGGPDSVALLHYLRFKLPMNQIRLIALSADHQLRGDESQKDIEYVRYICHEWDIDFYETRLDVLSYKNQHKVSTQVAARELRYEWFSEQMKHHEADYLALGHHGDDQIETMLMGFVRSTSTNALAGIPFERPFGTGRIIRPLLSVSKEQIYAYLKEYQISPRLDPTNEDTYYTRNYFRHKIMPLLKEQNQNMHETAQRLSEFLQIDETYLMREAEKLVHDVVKWTSEPREASFKIDVFKSYPLALQRRAYHLILNYLYKKIPKNLSYVHEELFFSLLNEQSNVEIDFPQSLKVEKSYDKIHFSFIKTTDTHSQFHYILPIPGQVVLPNGSVIIAKLVDQPKRPDRHQWIGSLNSIPLPLHIRTRKDGDRMRVEGLSGRKKIKDIFIDAKVPRRQRDTWPLVTDDQGDILWLVGLRRGELFNGKSASYILLEYKDGKGVENFHA